ncbi:MAG: hypothetical protein RL748_2732 [Pseudomonadota bacterium]|jgi:uncharacterized protein (DUF1800 family)
MSTLATATTPLTTVEAARFLGQAAFGGNDQAIAALQAKGCSAWLEAQFVAASDASHWDWLIAKGFNGPTHINSQNGIDASLWRKLMSSPDVLRQRIALALSEIFVTSLQGITGQWRAFAAAGYMDMLAAQAFGNFRTLIEAVSLSPAMGVYLGTRGNQKESITTGRQPDENYAREVMQLFTIGLYQLNPDGSQKKGSNGKPLETYTLDTVAQLARVFTGWDFNKPVKDVPDHWRRNMVINPARHSTASKSFLGVTIPTGTNDGVGELKIALDTLFNHPNLPPFFCKQLIQRLVTSNPSGAYVQRVAQVFKANVAGVRGDMKAVIRAILLDSEARQVPTSSIAGKLREPMLRYVQWARTFKATSTSGNWALGNTLDPDSRLGQSPMRSPSVFNFFRPGFVPGSGLVNDPNIVVPELQISTESTVVGYANFMQSVINGTFSDLKPDYSAELAIASDAAALVKRINTLLAAGQISSANLAGIQAAVNTINASTDTGKLNRVKASIMLVMCAPEYIVQK